MKTTAMNIVTENTYFLSFKQLEGSRGANLLSVGNFISKKQGDKYVFNTQKGEVTKTIEEIEDDKWRVIKLEDINIKSSLWKWYKNNPNQESKDLVFDNSLTEDNSLFYNDSNFFEIPILLKPEQNTLKFNLVINN